MLEDRTGLVVPERRPDKLARALCVLAGDRALVEAFGRAGRRRATESYDHRRQAARLEAIYDRLIAG